MKIAIIGWYGTETIGDRAILAGLISFFNKSFNYFEIKLGSLYPFLSERTINEDYSLYKKIIGKDIIIDIFNSKNSKELLNAIKNCDLLVMGGGPLMDLSELFMVEYAFKKAKKVGKKTLLLGCGVGPLFYKKYRKSVLNISLHSDISILRDNRSKDNLKNIYKEFNQHFDEKSVETSYDPAVECTIEFKKLFKTNTKEYIAVNLREFPLEYNRDRDAKNINNELKNFIKDLSEKYPDREIRLIPMHYFHIGGDDRVFLNTIALELQKENIKVQNANLTLEQTIEVYQNAYFNIGMRFHSVVLQTISSAKNFILDYTEPNKGKIYAFLADLDKKGFYNNRYISLQQDVISVDIIQNESEKFYLNENAVLNHMAIYTKKLHEIIK